MPHVATHLIAINSPNKMSSKKEQRQLAKVAKRARPDDEEPEAVEAVVHAKKRAIDIEQEVPTASSTTKVPYTNKQRVLLIASRGITARYRHFLEDLKKIIPHHKKDNKLDAKGEN